jgi:hypothetical protein
MSYTLSDKLPEIEIEIVGFPESSDFFEGGGGSSADRARDSVKGGPKARWELTTGY